MSDNEEIDWFKAILNIVLFIFAGLLFYEVIRLR